MRLLSDIEKKTFAIKANQLEIFHTEMEFHVLWTAPNLLLKEIEIYSCTKLGGYVGNAMWESILNRHNRMLSGHKLK